MCVIFGVGFFFWGLCVFVVCWVLFFFGLVLWAVWVCVRLECLGIFSYFFFCGLFFFSSWLSFTLTFLPSTEVVSTWCPLPGSLRLTLYSFVPDLTGQPLSLAYGHPESPPPEPKLIRKEDFPFSIIPPIFGGGADRIFHRIVEWFHPSVFFPYSRCLPIILHVYDFLLGLLPMSVLPTGPESPLSTVSRLSRSLLFSLPS